MFKELKTETTEGINLLKELNYLLPNSSTDTYDEALIHNIQKLFIKHKDDKSLSLDISLYEYFFEISNGFKEKEMMIYFIEIYRKLKKTWLIKDFRKVKVWYKIHLDGGGTTYAHVFNRLIREQFPNRTFFKSLEWCSGPGFIGFNLLANNLTQYLRLTDLNNEAIDCAKRTITENQLENRADVYVGDNLNGIPKEEKFDLVVASPPWAYEINNDVNTMISSDVKWKLHEAFYSQIRSFLFPGAIVCLSCFEPFEKKPEVSFQEEPWDIRPEEPILIFKKMIEKGGLVLRKICKPEYSHEAHMGYGVYFIFCEYTGH